MTNLIPQHEIDRICESADIVSIVESYNVKLRRMSGQCRGGCPFHGGSDKSTSFSVDPKSNLYHCFNCGAGGNVINFIMDIGGVSFVEAVESIESNIRYDANPSKVNVKKRVNLPMNLEKNEDAIKFYESVPIDEALGIKLVNSAEVIAVTDVHGNQVSCSLSAGVGNPLKPFGKKLIFGSCVIFGEIKDKVILTADYYQAKKLNATKGFNTICFFDPLNLHFIYREIKTIAKFMPVCHEAETVIQAEKCGFENYMTPQGKVVDVKNMAAFCSGYDARVVG